MPPQVSSDELHANYDLVLASQGMFTANGEWFIGVQWGRFFRDESHHDTTTYGIEENASDSDFSKLLRRIKADCLVFISATCFGNLASAFAAMGLLPAARARTAANGVCCIPMRPVVTAVLGHFIRHPPISMPRVEVRRVPVVLPPTVMADIWSRANSTNKKRKNSAAEVMAACSAELAPHAIAHMDADLAKDPHASFVVICPTPLVQAFSDAAVGAGKANVRCLRGGRAEDYERSMAVLRVPGGIVVVGPDSSESSSFGAARHVYVLDTVTSQQELCQIKGRVSRLDCPHDVTYVTLFYVTESVMQIATEDIERGQRNVVCGHELMARHFRRITKQ